MKTVLNAIILALSVTCLIVFIVYARNITLETPMFSKYTLCAIVYGWLWIILAEVMLGGK